MSIVTAECFINLKNLTATMAYDECSVMCESCNYCQSGDSASCGNCCNDPSEGD